MLDEGVPRLASPLLLLLAACQPQPPAPAPPSAQDDDSREAADPGQLADSPRFVSPSPGVELSVGWVPLLARLPTAMAQGSTGLRLDGEPLPDPFGLVRSRWSAKGGGVDYLSSLDLTELAPGEHQLQLTVQAPGEADLVLETRFSWARPACPVDLSLVDEAGQPLAGRVLVRDAAGPVLQTSPDAAQVDPMDRDTHLSSVFVIGQQRLWLAPGSYTLVGVQGMRRELDQQSLVLPADCHTAASLRFSLPLSVPTPGLLAADLHVHTGRSGDAFVPDKQRLQSLAAAGLDLAVITDHKRVSDPSGRMARLSDSPRLVSGNEIKTGTHSKRRAHWNLFPLSPDGPLVPYQRRPARALDLWQARHQANPTGTPMLVQLNHPRGLMLHPWDKPSWAGYGIFGKSDFVRSEPLGQGVNAWTADAEPETGTTVLDFDLLEVLNRFSWRQYLQVREDWFLLNHLGRFPTGTGNSDSHAVAVELPGIPVNLVRTTGEPGDFVQALQDGAVTVSGGPVVELSVQGSQDRSAGPGEQIAGHQVVAIARVRAASWVPVRQLRLVVDGQVHSTLELDGPLPPGGAELRVPLSLDRDAWIIAEAGHPLDAPRPTADELGVFAWVAPGYVPVGFTNPVQVDADGDGRWTPHTPLEAATMAARGLPLAGSAPPQDAPAPPQEATP